MGYEYSENGSVKLPRRPSKLTRILRILGGTLILILVFELVSMVINSLTVRPVVAQWGTIEKGCWTEALCLRDETTIITPLTGSLVTKIAPGARVPLGEIIAEISREESGDSSEVDLGSTQRLQVLVRETKALHDDFDRVNLEINGKRDKIKKSVREDRTIKEELNSLEQEKLRISRNIQSNQSEISGFQKILSTRTRNKAFITANQPGYLFYQYDGWEDRLKPDRFSELTLADFNRDYTLKAPEKQVTAGQLLGKIVNPFKQVIAVIVDTKQTGLPEVGATWWFRTGDNLTKTAIVNTISLDNGKMILALEDTSMTTELLLNRRNKIFVVFRRVSGICIPVQALFKNGSNIVVKAVKGEGYQEQKVSVVETDGVKAIIEGLDFGTTIISR